MFLFVNKIIKESLKLIIYSLVLKAVELGGFGG